MDTLKYFSKILTNFFKDGLDENTSIIIWKNK